MLRNGLCLVVDMAVRAVGDDEITRHRKSLLLGTLREDVLYVPLFGVTEYPSFSHFYRPGLPGGYLPLLWPGPRFQVDRLYARAIASHRRGHVARSFVALGRALHVLTDLSIPAHANRVVHERDPFEWFIEGNAASLSSLPVPFVDACQRPSDHVEAMARSAQPHEADATTTPLGRLLKRFGLRKALRTRVVAEQARTLVPIAAAHAAALLRRFASETREREGAHA